MGGRVVGGAVVGGGVVGGRVVGGRVVGARVVGARVVGGSVVVGACVVATEVVVASRGVVDGLSPIVTPMTLKTMKQHAPAAATPSQPPLPDGPPGDEVGSDAGYGLWGDSVPAECVHGDPAAGGSGGT